MGFGIDSGVSRNTNNTVQRAEKVGEDGTIEEVTTYGGGEEKVEEDYVDAFTNEATNAQVGTPSASVVMTHNLIESNTEYARSNKTSFKPLASGTTTT